jgi:hypothetical protein
MDNSAVLTASIIRAILTRLRGATSWKTVILIDFSVCLDAGICWVLNKPEI